MNFVKVAPDTVFDGDVEDMSKCSLNVDMAGRNVVVELSNLERIEKIASSPASADFIANSLGFSTSDLLGKRIYHGRKKGLRLYFIALGGDALKEFAIFSFGEFQPGRFLCIKEGVVSI